MTRHENNEAARFSVVIGFKDWGLERLSLTLRYLCAQAEAAGGEVILSDYGSVDPESVRKVADSHGAKYVYTETNGVWSRSRALNAGFAQSSGRTLIATDADMLFSPGALSSIVAMLEETPSQFALLQCRDLPSRLDTDGLAGRQIDWDELDEVSRYRPRYGMGGMIAFPREAFLLIRGFDERMQVYGGEDIDFAQRLRRAGLAMHWIDDPAIRMYHVWHPSSRAAAETSATERAEVGANAKIVTADISYIRNLESWRHKPDDARPLATVVICTRDRMEFLPEAVYSTLAQSAKDIQVIVVDDGSTDGTWEFLNSVNDSRLLALRQEALGIAAARNLAAEHSRAHHTVIFDDDDIMLPDRVVNHFTSLQGGDGGTYGGWIDFEDDDISKFTVHGGRPFSDDIARVMGGVYLHPTLMIETHLIQEIGYDTTFRSGSDFNLAMKWFRSGIRLRHMDSIAILRRLHKRQVTHADAAFQRASWATTRGLSLLGVSKPQFEFLRKREDKGAQDLSLTRDSASDLLHTFGPDGSAHRTLRVRGKYTPLSSGSANAPTPKWSVASPQGEIVDGEWTQVDASWKDIWHAASNADSYTLDSGLVSVGEKVLSRHEYLVAALESIAKREALEQAAISGECILVEAYDRADAPTDPSRYTIQIKDCVYAGAALKIEQWPSLDADWVDNPRPAAMTVYEVR